MRERISREQAYRLQPRLPEALQGLDAAASESGLEPGLKHLVKLRASQINGCGFCLDMHHREARRSGEAQQRLDVLPAWREVPFYTGRERAALALCEQLTLLAERGPVSDELYRDLQAQFSERELIDLVGIIIVINGWNRVVATAGFIPAAAKEE